ncbi:MAG TPA: beta-galactosidase, partial [Mariniflexile sp.]
MIHKITYLNKLIVFFAFLISLNISAQETQKIYLSGKDFKNPVKWDFMCTDGNNSKVWSTIHVPSNWELQGFGTYTYGRWYKELNEKEPSKEEGFYKYKFNIPASYKGKNITIVFGGAMTDTDVKVNGKSAGETHQGGFYEFKFDITSLLNYGAENLLEVHVSKHSSNNTVNNAERKTDWWLFGGIYRPVWLEVSPKSYIEHVAVDAKMDGSLTADLNLVNLPKNTSIEASIAPVGGNKTYPIISIPLNQKERSQTIHAKWSDVNTWDPESPNLYTLTLTLKTKNDILHTYKTKIGFRTLEFLKKDGIYVNGKKIIMKGINRHTIWPESGRST